MKSLLERRMRINFIIKELYHLHITIIHIKIVKMSKRIKVKKKWKYEE
jgi:hypothetical protein